MLGVNCSSQVLLCWAYFGAVGLRGFFPHLCPSAWSTTYVDLLLWSLHAVRIAVEWGKPNIHGRANRPPFCLVAKLSSALVEGDNPLHKTPKRVFFYFIFGMIRNTFFAAIIANEQHMSIIFPHVKTNMFKNIFCSNYFS
jgi:hypothetical protein